MTGNLKRVIKKTISFFKHNSYVKYFIFIAYALIGSLFFFGMYKVNEPNVFNFKQYKINQEFQMENNTLATLRYVYYDKKDNKIFISFQNKIDSKEKTNNKNIYPIVYRSKIVRGKLLRTNIYSSIEGLYVAEIQNVPSDFKSIKVSVILDDFEKTQKENRDRAGFFYVNNDKKFKETFNDFYSNNNDSIVKNIVNQSLKNMIKDNHKKIETLKSKISDYNNKISDYQATKSLPDNKSDDLAQDKIDSNIRNVESYIEKEEIEIEDLAKEIEKFEKEIANNTKNNLDIKEFKFKYDIEKEKKED